MVNMENKKSCVYCKSTTNLTKEHIFPSAIIKSFNVELLSMTDKRTTILKAIQLLGMYALSVIMEYCRN